MSAYERCAQRLWLANLRFTAAPLQTETMLAYAPPTVEQGADVNARKHTLTQRIGFVSLQNPRQTKTVHALQSTSKVATQPGLGRQGGFV